MRYDEEMRDRILLQIEQNDEFSTTRKDEAHHLGLLVDEGYVDGGIDVVDGVVKGAHAYRLRLKGYEKLAKIRSNGVEGRKLFYSGLRARCNELIQKSNAEHDRLMGVLSTGGIGLFFAFLGLISKRASGSDSLSCWQLCVGYGSVILWTTALILLLNSHFKSCDAARKVIKTIDAGKVVGEEYEKERKLIERLNLINAILTIAGIVVFSIFVFWVY
mgnify:CR=1 FL=1